MGKFRYSLRSLFVVLTLIIFSVGLVAWFARTYGPITVNNATGEVANKALRGYTTIPANATEVYVKHTPMTYAIIKFRLSKPDTIAWCESNGWQIAPNTEATRFEFVTPRGGGSWYHGKVVFVLVSE